MADFENLVKSGVSANLWSDFVYPWQLALPWQYENPTPIEFTNLEKN